METAWHYQHRPRIGVALTRRRRGQPGRVIALADRAQQRLCRRFRKLSVAHKPAPKIAVAIARELVGFLWAALQPVPALAEPFDRAIDIAAQFAQDLEKAHASGIVHRDIKPANIMCTTDRVVKIVSFGLAKLLGADGRSRTGTTLGTVAYMSPEQTRGEEVDHRSDLWSLGVLLPVWATRRSDSGPRGTSLLG